MPQNYNLNPTFANFLPTIFANPIIFNITPKSPSNYS